MKKFSFSVAIILFICSSSFATIRRVGFFGTPISGTDFYTFATAYTAANAGDTILMFPNTQISGSLTKKLTIIGPGNWLDSTTSPKGNGGEQADVLTATCSSLYLNAGSDGSVIMGFNTGYFYIGANNITIMRNRGISVYLDYNPAGNAVLNTSNLQLLGNYSLTVSQYYANGSATTSLNISNNFMYSLAFSTLNTYSGTISNNVWAYDGTTTGTDGGSTTFSYPSGNIDFGAGAFLFQNNILVSYSSSIVTNNGNYFVFSDAGNTVFNYNLALQTATNQNWGAGTGNVITPITNASAIFAAFPVIASSTGDARYALAAGSPALTIGSGSTAIGMYAGNNPYKLSTIPTIPTIYSLSSPQGNNPTGSTIQINVSTRGNN
jgi:hypothetical protein